jgi:hypothetical protein
MSEGLLCPRCERGTFDRIGFQFARAYFPRVRGFPSGGGNLHSWGGPPLRLENKATLTRTKKEFITCDG